MKVALICCGRLENRYAVEFVEHYEQLGFDHIFIADNNRDDEEHFEDVLQSYIDEDFVTIFDYRNKYTVQVFGYIEMYNKISLDYNYDWIFCCDFDEFLTLTEDKNIKEYLSRDCFKNANQIFINWKIYTDNNLIYDDGRPCLERFTEEYIYQEGITQYWNENICIKSFIRTKINNIYQINLHFFIDENNILKNSSYNNKGEKCELNSTQPINYDYVYIKHFTTKTIEEYVMNKSIRGTGDRPLENFNKSYGIQKFFIYNKKTKEKLNYLKEHNIEL